MVNAPYGMLSRNLTANLWYKDNLLSLLYILDYPSFFSYHLELWLLHFRIRITKPRKYISTQKRDPKLHFYPQKTWPNCRTALVNVILTSLRHQFLLFFQNLTSMCTWKIWPIINEFSLNEFSLCLCLCLCLCRCFWVKLTTDP